MSDKRSNKQDLNIQIGGNVSGGQLAIGNNIQQTQTENKADQSKEAEDNYSLGLAVNRATLAQLKHLLSTLFDAEELKSLCFDLDVQYDALPGSGTAAKARELLTYMGRTDRLNELLEVCKTERPEHEWPGL